MGDKDNGNIKAGKVDHEHPRSGSWHPPNFSQSFIDYAPAEAPDEPAATPTYAERVVKASVRA